MFELTKRRIRILFIAIAVMALILLVLTPTIRQSVKQGSLYQSYSKWRYNWRSPSDMGDGKTAKEIIIEGPMGIAEDANGNVYLSDREAKLVWKIEPTGFAKVIAGTGRVTGPQGLPSRILAHEIDFASPESIVVDKSGNLLIADSLNHSILKLGHDGYFTRVAGSGQRGYSGDGKQAIEAQLAFPYDIRLDSKGNLFIADVYNHCIRKVDGSGIISTVAGTGMKGYSGDGGPAIKAQLNMPYGIILDKDDNLLIADSDNNVIRKVSGNGIINTMAGTGQVGYEGDGGPALAAKFNSPQAFALDDQGRLYVDDEHNNAIRIIDPDGKVRSLIGLKGAGFSGDGGPASSAQIADPENMIIRRDGSILICARDNSRLRIVTPDGIINTFAGKGPTAKHEYFAPISLPTAEP